MAGARGDLIIYFATTWWDGPAGTDRQLATALGRYGPVLYVNPPISALTRLRSPHLAGVASAPRLRVHTPEFAQLVTHVVPGMSRPVLHHLVGPSVRWAVRAAVDRLFGRSRVPVAGVVSSRLEHAWSGVPARRRLLYMTDDPVAGAELLGLPAERMRHAEAVAWRRADAVAVVSPALREHCAAGGIDAQFIPNGCAAQAYAGVDDVPLPTDVPLAGPVAGFVGYINDRIDLALLEAVAASGCSLLVVGPLARGYDARRFTALTTRPNVCWVGERHFHELPPYLRRIDVGLTPYAENAFNRASFPLKTLEYLAAGRGVVATPLPAHTWLGTDLVTIADGPAEFAAQVRAALATPRTAALVARRQAFAGRHSWADRAARVASLLGLAQPAETAPAPAG